MKCPKCGSKDDVIELSYNKHSSDPDEHFKKSYPFLFCDDEDESKGYIQWAKESLMLLFAIFCGLWFLVGVLSFGQDDAPLLVSILFTVSGGLSSYLSFWYSLGENKIKNDRLSNIILKAKNNFYCKADDLLFDQNGRIELNERKEIKREISNLRSKKPNYIRYSMYSGLVLLMTFFYAHLSSDGSSKGSDAKDSSAKTKVVKDESNMLAKEDVRVSPIPNSVDSVDEQDMNGRYVINVGSERMEYVFLTWKKVKKLGIDLGGKYAANFSNYDGIVYLNSDSYGLWKMRHGYTDNIGSLDNPRPKRIMPVPINFFEEREQTAFRLNVEHGIHFFSDVAVLGVKVGQKNCEVLAECDIYASGRKMPLPRNKSLYKIN